MKFSEWIIRHASGKNMLLFLILSVVTIVIMSVGISPVMAAESGGLASLDTRLFYSYSDVTELLTALGPTGRLYYLYQKAVDSFFPIGYGMGLALALGYLCKKIDLKDPLNIIILLPIIGAIFDYTENILIATQIISFPFVSELVASIAAIATLLKWAFLYAAFVVLFLLLLIILVKRIRSDTEFSKS